MAESGGDEVLHAFAMLRLHAPAHLRREIAELEVSYFRGPSANQVEIIMARQIESAGNITSGLGEHGLANQLWALASRLRRRARGIGADPS